MARSLYWVYLIRTGNTIGEGDILAMFSNKIIAEQWSEDIENIDRYAGQYHIEQWMPIGQRRKSREGLITHSEPEF